MRLKYQLFLTLLAASALLIALMYAISSWTFSRGFLEYVNKNEADRLQSVADQVAVRYAEEGNWLWVNKQSVRRLTGAPRDRRGSENAQSPKSRRGPPRRHFIIADASRKPVFGEIKADRTMQWLPISSDDEVVGFLAAPKLERVDGSFDRVFESKQRKTFGLTALAMILLSGLLSVPLAGRIVKPLLKVNKAVGEISSGNYAHRVAANRRDEIGDLAANINSLGHTLEQNRDARQRWIAEISHELRTPLAVLRGEIEAVQDGVRTMDKTALASLHTEVLSLGRLIDDLHTLSLSDVGAINYQFEPVNLAESLNLFFASHNDTLSEHAISLNLDLASGDGQFLADAQRMEQLFSNLLQNTCRYTDEGGSLYVCLSQSNATESDTSHSRLHVIDWYDSSPGVEDVALSKLFDPLYRTEMSRNREFGGAGLGLAIVKRIVEAHQGNISASHSSVGGLHIRIELPVLEGSV